ncbi:MAG: glycine/betaine/sarcosine/D-proline family reductase selenoprotein B [Deltaproteobacteria bacterium]|nr:glycine/betaine/sarcosine/D-proline family reductase selenoprotein B [Deltaproteobacteria bacterium]
MARLCTMYFVNQFFVGLGGEEKGDVPVGYRERAVGPARRFQELCRDSLEVAVIAYCGDNYFAEHQSEALASLLDVARKYDVKMLVAGPAFGSGRYGYACIETCHFLTASLDIPCITGMHAENPGVELYQQYKDKGVFLFPTGEAVSCMEEALSNMARFTSRLITGTSVRSARVEGYIPRGFRLDALVEKTGVERAVDILLDKLAGRPFATEIPVESLKEIPVAPPITKLKDACLALLSTAGVVPPGNPDGFRTKGNIQWRKYSIDKLNSMKDAEWGIWHGGYNTVFMQENPNYGVPLDVCREIEREGVFRKLYPYFYVTPGTGGLVSAMQAIGSEILQDMRAEGIDGALLVST